MKDHHLSQGLTYHLKQFSTVALESDTEYYTNALSDPIFTKSFALLETKSADDAEKAQELLTQNIDLNCQDLGDNTPLSIAIKEGHSEIVALLIHYQTNINHTNSWKDNVLLLAASSRNTQIVQCMLNQGATIETSDLEENTPLLRAASAGNIESIQVLLDHHANINHVNFWKDSALMIAASKGYIKIVELLIQREANINAANLQENTALSLALENNHPEIAKLLINHNANMHHVNYLRKNALVLAVSRGHMDIAQILSNKGAHFSHRALLIASLQPLSEKIMSEDIYISSLLAYYGYHYRPHITLATTQTLRETAVKIKAQLMPIIERQQAIQYVMRQLELEKNTLSFPGEMYDFPTVIDLLCRLDINIVLRFALTLLDKYTLSDQKTFEKTIIINQKTTVLLASARYLPNEIKYDNILVPLLQSLMHTPTAYQKGLSLSVFPTISQKHLHASTKLSDELRILSTTLQIYMDKQQNKDNPNNTMIKTENHQIILTRLIKLFTYKPAEQTIEEKAQHIIQATYHYY